jgi:P27 family predicted phage terminase small subunit
MTENQPPPAHLAPETALWWGAVLGEYQLEAHHLRLLRLACEAWDRCQQAREILGRDGLTTGTEAGGLKAHPCIAIERDARLAFARLLRELDLDAGPPQDRGRPPALHSNRR